MPARHKGVWGVRDTTEGVRGNQLLATRNAKHNPHLSLHPNLSHTPTWQTVLGTQSEQRGLAERQGYLSYTLYLKS